MVSKNGVKSIFLKQKYRLDTIFLLMIYRARIIFVLVVVSLAILLSLPLPVSKSIKIRLVDFLSPLIKGSNYLVGKIFSVKDIFIAIGENKELKKRLTLLSSQLNELKEVQAENQRLSGLLNLKKSLSTETIACRVIARDAGTWYKTLVIDKGQDSGISIDMPVLAMGGVIGRVIDTSQDASRVLLITDINSSIGGITEGTRTVGLVEGDGSDGCIFNLISKRADVEPGSVVVTSGLGSIFPKGLMLGTIKEISEGGQGLYKVARLELSADIDRIEEVLVLKIQNSSRFYRGKIQN